jgi:hypothetical protein
MRPLQKPPELTAIGHSVKMLVNFMELRVIPSDDGNKIIKLRTKEHQAIYFNSNKFVLDKLNVVILDRLGKSVTGYFQWTMTLLIEYDNNNNGTQEYLQLEY